MIRNTRSWRVAAAAAAAGLTLAACGTTDDSDSDTGDTASGDGGASCDVKLAFLGPTTGDYANLGLNIVNGAKLAMEEFAAENPDCKVELEEFDSQGDPEKATPLADQIVNDDAFVGVIGPTFSGETDATGQTFADAGLVTVSASATNPDLSQNGWDTFHRLLGNDATQAPAAAKFIAEDLGSKSVFIVDDASEYGLGLADGIADELGDLVTERDQVQLKQTDFSATVTKVKASGADTLFYSGYYAEAGLFAKQLRTGGWEGNFVSGDGSNDPGFVEAAGATAAEGAYLTCPCAPATDDFAAKYEESSGQAPGTYSAEGYDSANVFLQGLAEGNTDRESLLTWVNDYDAPGLTKQVTFDETGEVAEVVIYAYVVKDGAIVEETEIALD
jgi:branched-chain amino acid transport system substrate-binding protein